MQTSFKYLIIVCVVLVSSCSLQKRLYNKGFYVSKTHFVKKSEQKSDTTTLPAVLSSIKSSKVKETPTVLSAEASNKVIEIGRTKTKPTLFTDGCDTLFLRNGTQILVKVSEINPEQIKFKYCDSPNEVLRTINKNDVNYIIYATGLKEVVEYKPNASNYHYQQPEDAKTNRFAIAGFVLSMVAFILLVALLATVTLLTFVNGLGSAIIVLAIPALAAIAAVVFCITAIRQINKNKDAQKGKALALIGLIFALILFLLLALLIITLLF